jgi:hypothetical protein
MLWSKNAVAALKPEIMTICGRALADEYTGPSSSQLSHGSGNINLSFQIPTRACGCLCWAERRTFTILSTNESGGCIRNIHPVIRCRQNHACKSSFYSCSSKDTNCRHIHAPTPAGTSITAVWPTYMITRGGGVVLSAESVVCAYMCEHRCTWNQPTQVLPYCRIQ